MADASASLCAITEPVHDLQKPNHPAAVTRSRKHKIHHGYNNDCWCKR